MMQWQTDWNKVNPKHGMGILWLPANNFINWYVETCMWNFMQLWAAPYHLPGKMGEIEKWTQTVSLNGIRSSNICKPD
jgi:hypothetical protein